MSIQAVAWALEQDFSYCTPKGHQRCCHAAKLVLISLANHADHTSGHCWPSAATIAREASCAEATVYRLAAALARNGFIDVKKTKGADGKQRSNNYWIRFDRKPSSWQFFAGDDDDSPDEPGDSNEPGDMQSPGETDDIYGGCESKTEFESPGPGDVRVTRQESLLEPSVVEPSVPEPPKPAVSAPPRFDATARAAEQAKLQAAEDARKPKQVFVIAGTRADIAWQKTRSQGYPTTQTVIDGKLRRGWWFPTLFPPEATHPATAEPPSEAKKAS
jgi:hypothetical protein